MKAVKQHITKMLKCVLADRQSFAFPIQEHGYNKRNPLQRAIRVICSLVE